MAMKKDAAVPWANPQVSAQVCDPPCTQLPPRPVGLGETYSPS